MSESIPAHLLADKGNADVVSVDKLEALKKIAEEFAQIDADIKKLEGDVKEKKERKLQLMMKEIPDLFSSVGTDRVGLPEFGVDVILDNYYHANIAADWELERREAAFKWLEDNGHGDLVKVVISVMFPRGSMEEARRVEAVIRKATNQPVDLDMTTPWNTLTAFVKERIEKFKENLPLETLGATAGRAAKIVKRKK